MTPNEILALPELTDDVENPHLLHFIGENIHARDGSGIHMVAVAEMPEGKQYKITSHLTGMESLFRA